MSERPKDVPNPTRNQVELAGMTIAEWNDRDVAAPDFPDERMHLGRCEVCGQEYDRRLLGDALYHERVRDHRPLAGSVRVVKVGEDDGEGALFRCWKEP